MLDMKVVGEGAGASLVVLTQRSFACLKESGVFKFVKKLEYNPASLSTFLLGMFLPSSRECGSDLI